MWPHIENVQVSLLLASEIKIMLEEITTHLSENDTYVIC